MVMVVLLALWCTAAFALDVPPAAPRPNGASSLGTEQPDVPLVDHLGRLLTELPKMAAFNQRCQTAMRRVLATASSAAQPRAAGDATSSTEDDPKGQSLREGDEMPGAESLNQSAMPTEPQCNDLESCSGAASGEGSEREAASEGENILIYPEPLSNVTVALRPHSDDVRVVFLILASREGAAPTISRLLRALYHPSALYLIHLDLKAPSSLIEAVEVLSHAWHGWSSNSLAATSHHQHPR